VAASQNSAPVNSLAPVKFLLDGLQFRLDLIETTVALNRALGIIRQGLLSLPRAAERYMRSGRLRNCPEGQETNRRSYKVVQKAQTLLNTNIPETTNSIIALRNRATMPTKKPSGCRVR